jgi:hypothetical protein
VSDVDWDKRVLCPDGACTGLIGPDGTCKVCGHVMPNWGDERMRGLQPDPDEDVDADEEPDDDELEDDEGEEAEDEGEGDEGSEEWSDRKLCDDGACTGVITTEGVCSVCGKRSAA